MPDRFQQADHRQHALRHTQHDCGTVRKTKEMYLVRSGCMAHTCHLRVVIVSDEPWHYSIVEIRSGTSTQRRSCHDCSPSSANCTPFAPATRSQGNGVSHTTCLRNNSHWTLNAFSNSPLSGTSIQSSRKSIVFGISGFHMAFGVFTRLCTLHSRRPATALPCVPSTCRVSSSSR